MARFAIIGLGLIGSSIGLALKKAKVDGLELVGYDKDPGVLSRAHKLKAVDHKASHPAGAVEDTKIVIVATPVMAIKEVFEAIAPYLSQGCIVTDTGSTKGQVMAWAEELLPSWVSFIGGHPMAGKEVSGPENADPHLFRDAPYCLIPGRGAAPEAVELMVGLVETLGALPYFVDAAEHDSYVAAVSHLPLLLSTALVTATTQSPAWKELSRLASSGYEDLSRLAAGNPVMSRDICLTNKESILSWVDRFIQELYRLRNLVEQGSDQLEQVFVQASRERARWLARKEKGMEEVSRPQPAAAGPGVTSFLLGERLARRLRGMGGPTSGPKDHN